MAYEIEKGVPAPPSGSKGRRASPLLIALRAMQPGDSVLAPRDDMSRNTAGSLASAVGREVGGQFVTRTEAGGTRVWRIA